MAKFKRRRNFRREIEEEEWVPKTDIGKKVAKKEIVSVDQIFEMGKPILEHQIVDNLITDLSDDILNISMTQRMTDCGRKMQFRAIAIVGDKKGHVGIGAGKSEETRPAIETAIKNAKRNIIKVPLGCGSWECGCGKRHTVPIKVQGHNGSVTVTLKPAPSGVGIVSNESVKKVLSLAGVKDAWTFSRGKTSNVYNTAMAVYYALDNLNKMKFKGSWESEECDVPPVADGSKETGEKKETSVKVLEKEAPKKIEEKSKSKEEKREHPKKKPAKKEEKKEAPKEEKKEKPAGNVEEKPAEKKDKEDEKK